jgi:hypothetical protein
VSYLTSLAWFDVAANSLGHGRGVAQSRAFTSLSCLRGAGEERRCNDNTGVAKNYLCLSAFCGKDSKNTQEISLEWANLLLDSRYDAFLKVARRDWHRKVATHHHHPPRSRLVVSCTTAPKGARAIICWTISGIEMVQLRSNQYDA